MTDMRAPETRRKVELEAARTLSDNEFTGMCPYHRAEGAYRKAARALGIEEDQGPLQLRGRVRRRGRTAVNLLPERRRALLGAPRASRAAEAAQGHGPGTGCGT